MQKVIDKIKSLSRVQLLAIVLVLAGIGIMASRAIGMFDFYKEVNYARQNNFAAGNLSTDLLRPWMTIRYVSVGYAIPQQYLFNVVGVPTRKESSMISLSRLNSQMKLGKTEDGRPAILEVIARAITEYRQHPVVTGLIEREVQDWMTLQYIANSTGLPVETFFTELGIPANDNAYKPLGFLADELNYSGGPKALIQDVQKVVDRIAPPLAPEPPVPPTEKQP
jgi:hypothetical protein